MKDIVYLDSAATAYPVKYFAKDYYCAGNPNSSHFLGVQANKELNRARQRIMKCLGVKSGKILFCRNATEAVEWLCNSVYKITYQFTKCGNAEHDSVYNCCDGVLHPTKIKTSVKKLNPKSLYLHQYVNQMTGAAFDIKYIGEQCAEHDVFFGSDFTASIGHYTLPKRLDSFCDSVWFSGHKFKCEAGIGAIWISDRLFAFLNGDNDSRNEFNLIHGTANVSAAIAMSYAMEEAIKNTTIEQKCYELYINNLMNMLYKNGVYANLICNNMNKTYAINAIYLPRFNADALVTFLSTKNICISAGHSACAANQDYRVLNSFGLTKEEAGQTIRVSFSADSDSEDVLMLFDGIMDFKKRFL